MVAGGTRHERDDGYIMHAVHGVSSTHSISSVGFFRYGATCIARDTDSLAVGLPGCSNGSRIRAGRNGMPAAVRLKPGLNQSAAGAAMLVCRVSELGVGCG